MRILFITANRLGDAILSTGLLDHLATKYPEAAITVATGPIPAPIFSYAPGLERCIIMEKQPLSSHWLTLWRQVFTIHWDIIVDLRRSALGYFLINKKHYSMPKPDEQCHRVKFIGRIVGLEKQPPAPRIWVNSQERSKAAKLIPECGPILAVAPAANWRGKQWRAKNFAALATRIIAEDGLLPGATVAVLASANERHQAEPVLAALPSSRCIDLVGTVGLLTLAACLERCSLFVGNDSGLMHMAAAAGIPTLGLFGPSRETLYGPWGSHCRWVRTPQSFEELTGTSGYNHRTTGTLMDGLQVQVVEDSLIKLWNQVKGMQDG